MNGVKSEDRAYIASLIAAIEKANERLYQLHASKLIPSMEKIASNPGDRGDKK